MGFVMPHALVLVGGVAVALGLVLQIVGLATNEWTKTTVDLGFGSKTYKNGLWEACVSSACGKITSPADWLEACRAFGILAVLALVGSLVCVVLTCFMSSQKIFPLLAAVAAVVGALCVLIEFAVYAGKSSEGSDKVDYGYSFGLTIVACILALAAALLFFIGKSKTQ